MRSARYIVYGIQPTPPSESTTLRLGNFTKVPEYIRSNMAPIELDATMHMLTAGGMSGPVTGVAPEVPTCGHSGMRASWAAASTGSQYPLCQDGRFKAVDDGFSGNPRPRAPFAAVL